MAAETKISSRQVYSGRAVHLRVDDVYLPSGRISVREVVEHPGAVAIVPFDDEGNVVMVRQHRYAVAEDLLEIPAGTLSSGEDPLDCAVRELEEETGFVAGSMERLLWFYPSPGILTEKLVVFVARGLTQVGAHPEIDEHIEVEVIAFSDCLRMVREGEIKDAKSIIGLLAVAGAARGVC